MNINSEQRELIEGLIKQNLLFRGHEDMLDLICAEVYKKSYLLLGSVSNIGSLKKYLVHVVDNTVLNLLKRPNYSSCQKRNIQHEQDRPAYIESVTKRTIEEQEKKQVDDHDKQENKSDDYAADEKKTSKQEVLEEVISANPYEGLIDPIEIFPKEPTTELCAKRIVDAIVKLDEQEPNKKYLEIFNLKYVQKIHQSKIAHTLKLSQADLSKRFCEMSKFVQIELS